MVKSLIPTISKALGMAVKMDTNKCHVTLESKTSKQVTVTDADLRNPNMLHVQ